MIILQDMEKYYWPHYDIFVPKENTLLIILFLPELKCTLQYGHIDTSNSKINLLVIILQDMKKYHWPHYDIVVPKENT